MSGGRLLVGTEGRVQAVVGGPPRRALGLSLPRHAELLARVWDHRLTLLVGPAGSGKSTLLARLADEARARGPVAIVGAGVEDHTVVTLLDHLRAAISAALGAPLDGPRWTDASVAADRLARLDEPLVVVVDDAHVLGSSAAEEALGHLVSRGPEAIRWVVAARRPPAFDVSSLLVAGQLHEIAADDLRFRSWEVEALFDRWYGQHLPPQEMAELARRSEGWVAGLQLFHLATAGRAPADRRRILRSLATRATVRDYLGRNVLDQQPPEVRRFLIRTSALDRLTGPLCDELLGSNGSRTVLRRLHTAQLFTQEVADDTWRYHDVFASFLRALLEEDLGQVAARRWHRRAGDLLAASGAADAALRAYTRAQAWDRLVVTLREIGAEVDTDAGAWVRAVPPSLRTTDPLVPLAVARTHLAEGDLAAALAAYREAEAGLPSGLVAATARLERAEVAAWVEVDVAPPVGWVALLHQAVRREPRSVAQAAVAADDREGDVLVAAVASILSGDIHRAEQLFTQVATSPIGTNVGQAVGALGQAFMAILDGRPPPDLRQRAGRAEALGLGWLGEVAHALVLASEPVAPVDRLAEVIDRRRAPGDPLSAAIVGAFMVLTRISIEAAPGRDGPTPLDARAAAAWAGWLERARDDARRVGASTVEAWARALSALLAVRAGDPDARTEALAAEQLARSAGVPGARALAFGALGATAGPSAAEYMRLGSELASECLGGNTRAFRRTVEWAVGPRRGRGPAGRLVGVGPLVDDLARRWRQAAQGGGLVVVSGVEGGGVSSVLGRVVDDVRDEGGPAVWVDAAAPSPDPLWVAVARRWAADTSPLSWTDDHGWVDVDLAAAIDAAVAEVAAAGDPAGAARALGEALALAGRTCPVLLVVDHAHRADADGRHLLAALAPLVAEVPAAVLVGHSLPVPPDLAGRAAAEVVLAPLGGGEVAELLEAGGLVPDEATVASLLAVTGGTPGLVREVVAQAPTAVSSGSPSWPGSPPTSATRGMDALLAALGPETAGLVRAAGALGPEVDPATLAAAVARPPAEVAAMLSGAVAAGALLPVGTSRLRFRVPALAGHVAAGLDDGRRVALHLAAADHLAGRDGARAGEGRWAGVADHLLRAAALDLAAVDGSRLLDAVEGAASEATRRDDPGAATAWYRRAAATTGGDLSPDGRARLQRGLARSLRRATGGPEAEAATLAAGRAALDGSDADLVREAACDVVATVSEGRAGADELAVIDAARRRVGAGPGLVLEAWLAGRGPLEPGGDADDSRGLALADDACAWAGDQDPRLTAVALAAWHDALWGHDTGPARRSAALGMAAAATLADDVDLRLTACRLVRASALEAGDAVGANVELARYARLAERRPASAATWRLATARAGQALLDGRYDDAERFASDAGDGAPEWLGSWVRRVLALARQRDLGPVAVEGRPDLGDDVRTQLSSRALDAWALAHAGEAPGAHMALRRFLAAGLDTLPRWPGWLPIVGWLGEAAALSADRESAPHLYRLLLPWAGQAVVVDTVVVWGTVDHTLGRLAAVLGHHDDAVAHLDAAVVLAQRLGSLPLTVTAQLDAGRARLAADVDRPAARVLVATAMDAARSAGMAAVVDDGEVLLARSRPPVRLAAVGPEDDRRPAPPRSSPPRAPRVEVRCLGPFELLIDGRAVDLSGVRPRARSVLWYLAMRGGEPVNREELAANLWPAAAGPSSRRSLQVAVSSLRTAPVAGQWPSSWSLIGRDADSYRVALESPGDCDVSAFDAAVTRARTGGSGAERARALEEALALYRGDLLVEAGPAEWVVGPRGRYQHAAADAATALAQERWAAGDLDGALVACERGLAIDRYRDALWSLLVELRGAQGDRAAAERARAAHAEMLAELGL